MRQYYNAQFAYEHSDAPATQAGKNVEPASMSIDAMSGPSPSRLCSSQLCKKTLFLHENYTRTTFAAHRSLSGKSEGGQADSKALPAYRDHGKPTTEEPRRAQHAGSILGRRARADAAAAGAQAPTRRARADAAAAGACT